MNILAAENAIAPGNKDLRAINGESEYIEKKHASLSTTASGAIGIALPQNLPHVLKQFGRYLFTGGAATVIDISVFATLTMSGLWYVAALIISSIIGMSASFWLSRQFVFGVYWKNSLHQYAVFALISLNSILANLGILQFLTTNYGWDKIPARIAGAACVALLSFTSHKIYSFTKESQDDMKLR